MATMTASAARMTLKARRPHSAECKRNDLGMFDRSGACERCTAFVALNEHLIPQVSA